MPDAACDQQLGARAATLAERLAAIPAGSPPAGEPSFAASLRLLRWRNAAAAGDPAAFAQALRARGISHEQAQAAVADLPNGGTPSWVAGLRAWLEAAAAARGTPPDWVSADGPPAAELLWPLVVGCEARLRERSQAALFRVPAIRRALQLMLGRWLGHMAAAAVAESRAQQEAWDLGGFLGEHPALARLMVTVAEGWSEAMLELAERFDADRRLLATTFADDAPLGDPVEVVLDQSDPHRGARTVSTLVFAGGLRIVYKPRSLALDAAFADFLGQLNAAGLVPPLRAPRTLARAGYGWCEWIEDRGPADASEWDELCRRAGALLGIVFLLEGRDIHNDNLVFAGPQPVIVDAEALLHPHFPLRRLPPQLEAGATLAWRCLEDSVQRTMMVCQWQKGRGGWRDSTALSALIDRMPPFAADPERLVGQIKAGFAQAVRLLAAIGRDQRTAERLLSLFEGCRARVVLRSTEDYGEVFRRSLTPACLRHGVDRSVELERLAHRLADRNVVPIPGELLKAEIESLSRGDIPYFTGSVSEDEIEGIRGLSGSPPLARAVQNLAAADEALIAEQGRILEGSLRARLAPVPNAYAPAAAAGAPDGQEIEAAALGIADQIVALAQTGGDGSMGWCGISRDPEHDRYLFQALPRSLFQGTAGIGLMLAACTRWPGGSRFAPAAAAVLGALQSQTRHLRDILADPALSAVHARAAAGTCEMLYACLRGGQLLGDGRLLAATRDAALEQASLQTGRCDRSGAAALALYRCGEAFDDMALRTEAIRRAQELARRSDEATARSVAARDPHGLALLAQLLAVAAAAAPELRAQARSLAALLPTRPFHAPSALARRRMDLADPEPPRPLQGDSLDGGGAGWIELALARAPCGHAAAEAAAADMVRAARAHGHALASGRCRAALCLDLAEGLAGVAYQLLRARRPGLLPSLLLLD